MDKKEMVSAINEAIYKAMEDDNFKAKLLKNANEAVLELTGKKIPVKVTIHDSDEKNLVFILQKWNPEGELDEDNLETVSGGKVYRVIEMPEDNSPSLASIRNSRPTPHPIRLCYGGPFPIPRSNWVPGSNSGKLVPNSIPKWANLPQSQ